MALSQPAGVGAGVVRKGAILGALSLYLDFYKSFPYVAENTWGQKIITILSAL